MLTKQDFLDRAYANIDQYPTVAGMYRTGNPILIQHIEAIATMMAMMSEQQEVAAMEVFSKERDATILADAAMRGIVPRATGVRVRVLVSNPSDAPMTLPQGRQITDSDGNIYMIEAPVTVAAGATMPIIARQGYYRVIEHVVTDSIPFYPIQIPAADDGSHLASITVADRKGFLEWSRLYTNINPGDRVFHVEGDDLRRVYVRLGNANVVGVQPVNGDKLTLTIGYAMGDVMPKANSPFSLEYTNAVEAAASLTLHEILQKGEDPITVDTLRDLARYPSVYSDSAVFLGEFNYIVRKAYPNLEFVNVWNELQEEAARLPSVDNINALFVALKSSDGQEAVLQQFDGARQDPDRVSDESLSLAQKMVKRTLLQADDSYRIYFYTPVQSHIHVQVNAKVAPSYVGADVEQQIRAVILKAYGASSKAARTGYNKPLYQRIYKLLRESVPALTSNEADWDVHIQMPANWGERPELWIFVAEESLTVTVETVNIVQPTWGV